MGPDETRFLTMAGVELLLAEDHPGDAALILESLAGDRLDARVHVVPDGETALDFLFCRGAYADRASEPLPRLILMELGLPGIGGLEVLRAIRSEVRTRAIPVVMFASSRREADVIESYRSGANSYVYKPGDFDRFREVVRRLGSYWLMLNEVPPAATRDGRGG
jgi:two-component system response regulator